MAAPKYAGLEIRMLADKSQGERVARFNEISGERYLLNPETGQPEPWPLLGLEVRGEGAPRFWKVPTSFVTRGQAEGFITVHNPQMAFRPGGPAHDPWRVTHTFQHIDGLTLHTLQGDIEYEVYGKRGNPDKYMPEGDPAEIKHCGDPDGEVEWFYNLKATSGVLKAGDPVEAFDIIFNGALGRGHQWAAEINASVAPYANSALIVALYRRGSATAAATRDLRNFSTLEADANIAELVSGTNANYGRKTLIDATPVIAIDDTNERVDIDFPDQTWVALGTGGTAITDLGTGFDNDTTAGTDANILTWSFHTFSVTADGSDVTAVLPTGGFWRAQG